MITLELNEYLLHLFSHVLQFSAYVYVTKICSLIYDNQYSCMVNLFYVTLFSLQLTTNTITLIDLKCMC